MPAWPVGTRSKGNEGVTASIQTTPGSIGYVEFAYAMNQKMPMAQLENKSGELHRSVNRVGPGRNRLCESAGQPNRVGARSFGERRLSDRDLHLVPCV